MKAQKTQVLTLFAIKTSAKYFPLAVGAQS